MRQPSQANLVEASGLCFASAAGLILGISQCRWWRALIRAGLILPPLWRRCVVGEGSCPVGEGLAKTHAHSTDAATSTNSVPGASFLLRRVFALVEVHLTCSIA